VKGLTLYLVMAK